MTDNQLIQTNLFDPIIPYIKSLAENGDIVIIIPKGMAATWDELTNNPYLHVYCISWMDDSPEEISGRILSEELKKYLKDRIATRPTAVVRLRYGNVDSEADVLTKGALETSPGLLDQ